MSLLRRALAGVSATVVLTGALVAGTAAPAAAELSSFCPQTGSTRLLTAQGGQYKVWLYQTATSAGAPEYHLCYAASPYVAGDIVVTSLGANVVPTVNWSFNDTSCPDFFTVQDPVALVTELGSSTGTPVKFCFGAGLGDDAEAVSVSFTTPTIYGWPSVELWLDKGTTAATAYCSTVNDYQCRSSFYPAVRVV